MKTRQKMTSPSTIAAKFLPRGDELGVVAVGFSGGQVCPSFFFMEASPSKKREKPESRFVNGRDLLETNAKVLLCTFRAKMASTPLPAP